MQLVAIANNLHKQHYFSPDLKYVLVLYMNFVVMPSIHSSKTRTKLSSVGGGRQLRLSELDASLFLASGMADLIRILALYSSAVEVRSVRARQQHGCTLCPI